MKTIAFADLCFLKASRRRKVAIRFSSKWMEGSVSPTRTSGFAARWNTNSASFAAFSDVCGSFKSPLMNLKCSLSSHDSMFLRLPLLRLSITVTSWFSFIKRSTRWLPMKPAPPVTRTFKRSCLMLTLATSTFQICISKIKLFRFLTHL